MTTPTPLQPPRIMIAKPGLDGHDRGAVVVVQGLRDAGFDLIYTGLRRTAREIAVAAAQEDVDVLGLSTMSGAHMTLLGAIAQELAAIHWRPTVLLAGGIIPAEDAAALRNLGFDLVFGPGTPLADIAAGIHARVPQRTGRPISKIGWVARAQALTVLESATAPVTHPANVAAQRGRIAVVIGQGGAGKSTLIGGLLRAAAAAGKKIAVIANDPAGPARPSLPGQTVGRGAILADRLRMPMDLDPDRILIRSLPVRDNASAGAGASSGDAIGASATVGAMAARLSADIDLVLVETIGVGQNQIAAAPWADERIAVVAPGMGDHWQLRKSAILQTADRIVISKADLPAVASFSADVEQVLHDSRKDTPSVHRTSESDATSVTALLAVLTP
ncbi:MAG TPA: cobalamin-dependent protein [Planctomycetota bacterium]|nr:cobalamin-dependent protein [Planctomycetota bacterium]